MMSSSLSLYANATNRNNPGNAKQPRESFSEQIISLNKAIRTEYIKLSEQQLHQPVAPAEEPVKPTKKVQKNQAKGVS